MRHYASTKDLEESARRVDAATVAEALERARTLRARAFADAASALSQRQPLRPSEPTTLRPRRFRPATA